jgi:two-component system, OmpR family, sensor kinase
MRRYWPWLLAILPGLLGITAASLLQSGSLPNQLLSIQADVGTSLLLVGLALSGVCLGLLGVHALDQRELARRLVEEREQAGKARTSFLRNLDHELKNPLTAIRNGLINLAGTSSDEERKEALARVRTEAERIGKLNAGLRILANLEEKPLSWTSVDVAELLELAVDEARQQPEAENRQLDLIVPKAPWPLPQVRGDPDLLYLAISNLLDNALKFTKPKDTIEVRASDNGNAVIIQIADTGLGVPDDEIPHLFEELFRSREVRAIPGSGLGLALVKAAMEKHGGAVSVRSRAEQGSVFTLSIPIRADSSPSRG